MAITLLLKKVPITEVIVSRLKKDFNLSKKDIAEVEHWNGPSPYVGTIINTNKEAQYKVYPFAGSKEEFLKQYTEGEVWE